MHNFVSHVEDFKKPEGSKVYRVCFSHEEFTVMSLDDRWSLCQNTLEKERNTSNILVAVFETYTRKDGYCYALYYN